MEPVTHPLGMCSGSAFLFPERTAVKMNFLRSLEKVYMYVRWMLSSGCIVKLTVWIIAVPDKKKNGAGDKGEAYGKEHSGDINQPA